MSDAGRPDPLPEGWLPEPAREAGDEAVWEERVSRIVAAAGPRLRELRRGRRTGRTPEASPAVAWLGSGAGWRTAAALAAAAVLVLVLTRPAPPEVTPGGSPALGAIVAEGDPASLWRAAGAEAHPVLALIALEEETP